MTNEFLVVVVLATQIITNTESGISITGTNRPYTWGMEIPSKEWLNKSISERMSYTRDGATIGFVTTTNFIQRTELGVVVPVRRPTISMDNTPQNYWHDMTTQSIGFVERKLP